MANGTPSKSISLGADLLEQMGDLKGAAKELASEARTAKRDVVDAKKEFKELEKQQKANEKEAVKLQRGLDRMTGKEKADAERQIADLMDSSKVDSALQKVLAKTKRVNDKQERSTILKERAKSKADMRRSVEQMAGRIDRGVSQKLFRAEDQLQSIAKALKGGGAASKAVGGMAGKLAGVAGSAGEGMVSAIGALGPVAAVAGAAYAGFKAGDVLANMERGYRKRAEEIGRHRQTQADATRDTFLGLSGKAVSQDYIKELTAEETARGGKAKADVERRSIFGGLDMGKIAQKLLYVGTSGALGQEGGKTTRELDISKRTTERQRLEREFRASVAVYGAKAMGEASFAPLEESQASQDAWEIFLESNGGKKAIVKVSGKLQDAWEIFLESNGGKKIIEEVGGKLAGEVEFKQAWASEHQAKAISALQETRRLATIRANELPENIAERHLMATRMHGLEKWRQSNEMQTARF